jgi:signal transduction histidine kinase
LLAVFLLVTLLPAVLLLVFGWRMLRQETELQFRQAAERREQVANLAAANIRQGFDAVALRLEKPDSIPAAEDSAVVELSPQSVRGNLLFYPFSVIGEEAPEVVFAEGEQLELRGSPERAAGWFAILAESDNPAIRAGALIRQARALHKVSELSAALAILDRAASIKGAAIRGVPADLFARWMACLLSPAQRQSRALALHADLMSGKWKVDRPTFELHESDAADWAGGSVNRPSLQDLALAAAADWLWKRPREPRGHQTVTVHGRQMTVMWRTDGVRFTALIAGPDYVREHWLANLPGVQLLDPGTPTHASGPQQVQRFASETGLPWTIVMPEDETSASGRTGFWFAGLGVLVLLVLAGAYFVARAAERELKVARLQADFVAAVSHEFRTPLTTLRQFSEVLRDGRVESEERRQTYYEAIARHTERLHQLVESLLDFGRMEAGRSPYRLAPLDARRWVTAVVEQFSREVAPCGFQVKLACTPEAVTIVADPPALTNALWNLMDNAVKYSPDCRTVWVSAEQDAQRLAVRVRDQGLGIPHGEQRDIFRKFVRGAQAKQLGVRGTGIGLAMVEHIIKAHGGEVTLESEPGVGSTFTILLPCRAS